MCVKAALEVLNPKKIEALALQSSKQQNLNGTDSSRELTILPYKHLRMLRIY